MSRGGNTPLQERSNKMSKYRAFFAIVIVLFSVTFPSAQKSFAVEKVRCFTETPFCISPLFIDFWEKNGGLTVFGLPIGPLQDVYVNGKVFPMQRFERNRIEWNYNNKPQIGLGRLGVELLEQQGRNWFTFPKNNNTNGCRVFAETGHAICGDILKMWRTYGIQLDNKKSISESESIALFGFPISSIMTETLSDGKEYQVQWFERARFELHPENPAPYNVLIGLLGNEVIYNETSDDRPLHEYSLNINDLSYGMSEFNSGYYSMESAAQNWDNPNEALANFKRLGKINSYATNFDKPSSIKWLDKYIANRISVNIVQFGTSSGANEFISLLLKEVKYKNTDRINFPIVAANESIALTKTCYDFTDEYTCIDVIFRQSNNIVVILNFYTYRAWLDMERLNVLVQMLAWR